MQQGPDVLDLTPLHMDIVKTNWAQTLQSGSLLLVTNLLNAPGKIWRSGITFSQVISIRSTLKDCMRMIHSAKQIKSIEREKILLKSCNMTNNNNNNTLRSICIQLDGEEENFNLHQYNQDCSFI